MKSLYLILLCLTSSALFAHDHMTPVSDFGENPGNLKMFVHLPYDKPDTSNLKPMVVALHGCSQNSRAMAFTTDWNRLADENNFVVLYPEQRALNNVSNCFNWFNLEDITINSGEIGSIKNMMDYAIKHYHIDPTRIYVYGLSAGAAMSVALLAVYPEYFQSGAIFAGAPYKAATSAFQAAEAMVKTVDKTPREWAASIPDRPDSVKIPNLIVYHGEEDHVVNIRNSEELIEQWTAIQEIDTIPDQIIEKFESAELDRIVYTDTSGVEKIVFYRLYNIGHAVAVNTGEGEGEGGHSGMFARNIGFFSTLYIAKDFGLIEE